MGDDIFYLWIIMKLTILHLFGKELLIFSWNFKSTKPDREVIK